MQNTKLDASVVIPVYNAQETILLCLNSLDRQNYPKDKYEIICIDDGSTDSSLGIINSFQSGVCFKNTTQQNSGPALARNSGAQLARGKVVVFTDSDCELSPDWLNEMLKPFNDEHVGGVQGRYKTKQKELCPLLDQIDIEGRYRKMMKSENIDSIGTYSAAYRLKLFLDLGGFNTKYKVACGEDIEFSYLVARNGYKMVFANRAICYHTHPDTFQKYLKTKFSRGYWRTLLYKNNKDKIINDSYTSSVMKFQYFFVVSFFLSVPIFFINPKYSFVPLVCISCFLALCTPFISFAIKYDLRVAIVSPVILLMRSISFIAGMFIGIIHVFRGKLD
jgi:cellulose synthase/poly-beta-1,6-N-acetylglucosamine synthase-like glycosyltransferase